MRFWSNMRLPEMFLLRTKTYVLSTNIQIVLNPVCPKFISNKRVFRKIGVGIFRVVFFLLYMLAVQETSLPLR